MKTAPFLLSAALLIAGCESNAPTGSAVPASPGPPNGTSIYSLAGTNMLAPIASRAVPLVYVPNSRSASVTVIDPKTYRVVRTFPTGKLPQHVVPSYDMKTLWVANNDGNSLTPIDPLTGKDGPRVSVDDPYNLYFTPDGRYAMVIAERRKRLDWRDAHSMALVKSLQTDCKGVDHVEFAASGRYAIATCEFSAELVKIDLARQTIAGYLALDPPGILEHLPSRIAHIVGKFRDTRTSMPQDIRSSPDGRVFYVADMKKNGVFLIDPDSMKKIGFIPTGVGAHGLYPSRDGRFLYVTNRGWNSIFGGRHGPGSIGVIDFATRRLVATWPIPGGGSPDMGNVTADGKELWVSGRYDDEVYVFDTRTGKLTHRIPVGREPHGLTVWPQPGTYSLGHTGNMR